MKNLVLFAFLLIAFSSCRPEPITENNFENVDVQLWDYFETFENEAARRGVEIDLASLDLLSHISEISEDGVAGTCQYSSQQSNVVTIDQSFWNRASNDLREMVVFHELGHCVLFRDHRNASTNDGICLSIMNSGLTDCTVYYNEVNRDLYLDELFTFSE